ncbi:hypothetical protein ID866_7661 [Astraeus odoratus]|nr:hypothetical protein ID866_7661 [Astraeus odoratus]
MERPTKKSRLQGPDGFQKPRSEYKPPDSIKKFVSAFDAPTSSASPKPPSSKGHKKPTSKTGAVQIPQNPFASHVHDVPPRRPGPSVPRVPRVPSKQLKPPSLGRCSPVQQREGEKGPSVVALKPLKPPLFAHVPHVEDKPQEKPSTSIMALQPVVKPPSTPSKKPKSLLKPPPMPTLVDKPALPLKPLAPPPPVPALQPPPSPSKNMKTILTTSVAQATDPSKEGAGAELLALFLQQHGHNFTSVTDQELQRGVMVSPDKRSRGKEPKFIRGGFAERAQHRISCQQTDFALWRRQMEQKVESASKITSDIQLRVLRILHVRRTPERPRSAPVARSGLALCRLKGRHKLVADDLTTGTYVVLFNFTPVQGSASVVSSAEQFEEGRDVHVWVPWQKIDVSNAEDAAIRDSFSQLDALNPPQNLLVVSRFCFLAPS